MLSARCEDLNLHEVLEANFQQGIELVCPGIT
jgi:hypothetical protein